MPLSILVTFTLQSLHFVTHNYIEKELRHHQCSWSLYILIHLQRRVEDYHHFFACLQKHCPKLITLAASGTDGEQSLVKALELANYGIGEMELANAYKNLFIDPAKWLKMSGSTRNGALLEAGVGYITTEKDSIGAASQKAPLSINLKEAGIVSIPTTTMQAID